MSAIGFILSSIKFCHMGRNLDAKIWVFFDTMTPLRITPKLAWDDIFYLTSPHFGQVTNDMHKYWICGNDPCISQLQTVIEKGFTNVLEVKTTKICRGDCWEHVYAKKTFCVTIMITAFLIDQCSYTLLRIKKYTLCIALYS